MSDSDRDSATWWFRVALGDLNGARVLANEVDVPWRIAWALAQQASEKALKAAIAFGGTDPPRTHDLLVLTAELGRQGLTVSDAIDLVALADGVGTGRYPALEEPDIEPANLAILLADAQSILDIVRDHLKAHGLDIEGIEPA